MNTLQHLDKILRKHHAQLRVTPRGDAHEIVLSIPASQDTEGTLAQYALEYRLGVQFPAPTPQPAPLLDADDNLPMSQLAL